MSEFVSTVGQGSGVRRTLVSGGAGFIGSHLVDQLLARGDRVTVVDNLSTGNRSNLPDEHPHLRFIEASVKDAIAVFGPGERFDEIYHLAAAVGVQLVLDDPIGSIETNVEQTAAVLRFARTAGRDGAPSSVLITSSSEVYGKPDREVFCEDDDVVYGPTTVLRWSYAQTKAIDEYLGLAHHARLGVPVVVVRLFNTVGPRQVGSYGMVLPRFVASALRDEPLEVYGDGRQSRCFCDVRDVAKVLPRLLETSACHGRVFNVGSDEPISIGELAQLVVDALGSGSPIRTVPYEQAYPDGFEDLPRRRPSIERVREAVGFEPKISIRQTILDLADAMREGTQGRMTRT
ncbi:MAG: NAD-dependent epimerase/dehydratase family protein [Planctomycetota bacterium]|nr:MAG: NAD-dependent epimerase/dehydratase family protein [Planctomycetota bacterium]